MCVLRNSVKMEMIACQNDRPVEQNVNFLLTATVHLCSKFLLV